MLVLLEHMSDGGIHTCSPTCPEEMDWSKHFPEHFKSLESGPGCVSTTGKKVEWVDIGCGFGGLTCALAPLFPNELILGMGSRLETESLFVCEAQVVSPHRHGNPRQGYTICI